MIDAEWLYWLCGLFFLFTAGLSVTHRENPKRFGAAAFWALLGLSFCYSTFVVAKTAAAWPLGIAVLVIGGLGGLGALGKPSAASSTIEQREAAATRLGNRLFVPALLIPLVALVFATMLASISVGGKPLFAAGTATLTGLGAGALIAVLAGVVLLRPAGQSGLGTSLREGSRLVQSIGWAVLLPQMLAVLGLLFDKAGVGKQVGTLFSAILPEGSLFVAVVLYCVGMALFTVIMGNAFAAFPVMTAAIGWPVLIQHFHGNPALVFAVGMLAGFCGTLCTPMAANFNIVPAVLLEIP